MSKRNKSAVCVSNQPTLFASVGSDFPRIPCQLPDIPMRILSKSRWRNRTAPIINNNNNLGASGQPLTLGARGFSRAVSGFGYRPAADEAPRRSREKTSGT